VLLYLVAKNATLLLRAPQLQERFFPAASGLKQMQA
jgi:hypothetical protein